ncbi:MAG: thiamine-phosphate kinase [Burkholderiales bacterium]
MTFEFDIIRRYFTRENSAVLGVGDDAALVEVTPGHQLAVSTDMLVSGRHFFADADPFKLGHKSLAVNLSDMAAMGAAPRWALLSLALPGANERWLERFSTGFFALADEYKVALIGGDTTKGPLNICVTIMGETKPGEALRRDGAKAEDEIWVSGLLGDAALGLAALQNFLSLQPEELKQCELALHAPRPQVALGLALRGIANSAIDVSDGLLADLGHILERANVGAEIHFPRLPVSKIMQAQLPNPIAQQCLLAGGDDYQLCFTAPADLHAQIVAAGTKAKVAVTSIGRIKSTNGLIVLDADNHPMKIHSKGFDHFA